MEQRERNQLDPRLCLLIEQEAARVLEDHSSAVNGYVDVVQIAKAEGFTVGEVDFEDNTDGILLVDTKAETIMDIPTQKLIVVSKQRDYNFKRFILAHELGHYFLRDKSNEDDKGILLASRDARHGRDAEENMYDRFAACLLIPKESFLEKWNGLAQASMKIEARYGYLADLFRVPLESIQRRSREVDCTEG